MKLLKYMLAPLAAVAPIALVLMFALSGTSSNTTAAPQETPLLIGNEVATPHAIALKVYGYVPCAAQRNAQFSGYMYAHDNCTTKPTTQHPLLWVTVAGAVVELRAPAEPRMLGIDGRDYRVYVPEGFIRPFQYHEASTQAALLGAVAEVEKTRGAESSGHLEQVYVTGIGPMNTRIWRAA